ncbi:MAG: VOC family protein [Parvularculaceae bacterium]
MNITGPEGLLMATDDLMNSHRFLTLYGLRETHSDDKSLRFEALDGSGVEVRLLDDPELPPANIGGPTLRASIWGVRELADLEAIAEELSKDRQVEWKGDVLQSTDDDRNALFFRVTQRRKFVAPDRPKTNIPGYPPERKNERVNFDDHGAPRQMGHVVYWTRNPKESIKFYRDRLGFRVTDSFRDNMGVFARSAAHYDHHSLFLMRHEEIPPSFQHAEFTFGDPQDVMAGGYKLTKAGYETAFGPGRFELGSNWFWYLKTPMGGAFELAADMDYADDDWVPGEYDHAGVTAGWHFKFNEEWSRQR